MLKNILIFLLRDFRINFLNNDLIKKNRLSRINTVFIKILIKL
jgi:hypothetical protein